MSKRLFKLARSPIGDLIVGIAFGKLSKLLPVQRQKDTDKVIAFWHPKSFWEQHIVIVPKKPINKLTDVNESDLEYVGEIFLVVKELVEELRWEEGGYSLLVNGGDRQDVGQLHFHLHSGKLNGS